MTMEIEQSILQKLQNLPLEKKVEVLDFVDFLLNKEKRPKTSYLTIPSEILIREDRDSR